MRRQEREENEKKRRVMEGGTRLHSFVESIMENGSKKEENTG